MSYKIKMRGKKPPPGFDLIEPGLEAFEQKMKDVMDRPHEGLRKCESQWPIFRLHWERNRFIYEAYYREEKISRKLFEYLVNVKIADGPLIAKWRQPGFELLCSMGAIQKASTNFGTTSICRVPAFKRGGGIGPCVSTGCITCVSGEGINGGPRWWTDSPPERKTKGGKKRDKPDEPELDDDVAARLAKLTGGD